MTKTIGLVALLTLLTQNCGDQKTPKGGELSAAEKNALLPQLASQALDALAKTDIGGIAAQMEPGGTLLFSPYAYIEKEKNRQFTAAALQSAAQKREELYWGDYDATGDPIKLTLEGYFKQFVNNKPYKNCGKVGVNKSLAQGNSINNLGEAFPGCDFVEYYCEGSEQYGGMDWGAVRLVYKAVGRKLYLVAVVHDRWTS